MMRSHADRCALPNIARILLPLLVCLMWTQGDAQNAPSAPVISGGWHGLYLYPDGRPGVSFLFELAETNSRVTGRIAEINTFGDRNVPFLFADVIGDRSGNLIVFSKTYDGTGGPHHTVKYTGTIDPNGAIISGTWSVGNQTGTFQISK